MEKTKLNQSAVNMAPILNNNLEFAIELMFEINRVGPDYLLSVSARSVLSIRCE